VCNIVLFIIPTLTTTRHRAATTGSTAFMALLLNPPAGSPKPRLNTGDRVGNTPLHLAMESGHAEAAVMLIEAGADRGRVSSASKSLDREIDRFSNSKTQTGRFQRRLKVLEGKSKNESRNMSLEVVESLIIDLTHRVCNKRAKDNLNCKSKRYGYISLR
jgi:hypothetical protein